jgi:hypothetical protein
MPPTARQSVLIAQRVRTAESREWAWNWHCSCGRAEAGLTRLGEDYARENAWAFYDAHQGPGHKWAGDWQQAR